MSNLGITQVAASQDQKEVTINAADARLDAALTEILSVSVASGNATVTTDQYQQAIHIVATGASVAGRTITLPAVERGMMILSASEANVESVEFLRGTGSVVLLPGQVAVALTDGTANGLFGYVLADSGGVLTLESLTNVALTAPADGDVLTYDSATGEWVNAAPAGGGGDGAVPVSLWVGGTMTDGETLGAWIAPYACSFPAGASGSYFNAGAAATGSTTISVKKNGTEFATLVWAATGTVATVTISSTTSFAVNDVMTFVGPATKDTTLADVRGNLYGTRT